MADVEKIDELTKVLAATEYMLALVLDKTGTVVVDADTVQNGIGENAEIVVETNDNGEWLFKVVTDEDR